MCRCMLMRMFAMARWAATPSTCESENAVAASTSVAAPAASASGIKQIGPPLADDVVDEELGGRGKNEAGEPVDEHQDEAEGQPPPMGPDQFPGLGPGVGDVRLALGWCHSCLRRGKWAAGFRLLASAGPEVRSRGMKAPTA